MSEVGQLLAIRDVVYEARKKANIKYQGLLLEAEDVLRYLLQHGKDHQWFDDVDGLEALAHILHMLRNIESARGTIAAAS